MLDRWILIKTLGNHFDSRWIILMKENENIGSIKTLV